jgi:hypothetical protein
MKARRTLAFLAVGAVTIVLGAAGCGNSPGDSGGPSKTSNGGGAAAGEGPSSSGGYGY